MKVTRAKKDKTMNNLAKIIEHLYGPRCSRHEAACMCCNAWAMFDCMDRLTDSSLIDTPHQRR